MTDAETVGALPTSPETLLQQLDQLNLPYTVYEHEAVFTVEESQGINVDMPGYYCRNLFLRDKKKQNFLLCLCDETPVDLKKLPELLGSGRLSFGSADRLWEYLGVRPGSVCPFAAINDHEQNVTVFFDAAFHSADMLNFHPLINTRTIGIKPADLVTFMGHIDHEPQFVDLTAAAP